MWQIGQGAPCDLPAYYTSFFSEGLDHIAMCLRTLFGAVVVVAAGLAFNQGGVAPLF